MPDKSKRRKNNKNKRKNKNSRTEINPNTNSAAELACIGECRSSNDTNLTIEQEPKQDILNNDISPELGKETQNENNVHPSQAVNHNIDILGDEQNLILNVRTLSNTASCFGAEQVEEILFGQYNIPTENSISEKESKNEHLTTFSVVQQSKDKEHVTFSSEILKDDVHKYGTNNETESKQPIIEDYVVETPEQSQKHKPKLGESLKSKSLDGDDSIKITEVTDVVNSPWEEENSLAIIDIANVIISDAESDVEWEKTDDLKDNKRSESKELVKGNLSIMTIPLNMAKCDQIKSLSAEEELSLRHYLETLDLSSNSSNISSLEIKTEIEHIINREIKNRLRKKGMTEDFLSQRLAPPRVLDVIDEEGSGESSLTSRRHSYLNDKKSDTEELEDEVFEEKKPFDSSIIERISNRSNTMSFGRLVPQQCMLVDAKIKDPEISEARGNWTMKTVEKMAGAEIIYLTDSSSSTSSIYDVSDEKDENSESDLSVRMITPTIEVTDTEQLLKNTFISDSKDKPEKIHEIEVLSTDNIKTNLYVKDIPESDNQVSLISTVLSNSVESTTTKNIESMKDSNSYDVEIKVLKGELNDAMNNLIKEVSSNTSFSEDMVKEEFVRQDSSSSVCSSQCTAKYNPSHSSLNDISNILHDEANEANKINFDKTQTKNSSHVKDVFDQVTEKISKKCIKEDENIKVPLGLRQICVTKIASLPYGEKILQELADVSKRLQNIAIIGSGLNAEKKIDNIEKESEKIKEQRSNLSLYSPLPYLNAGKTINCTDKNKPLTPPPVLPRNSSLKKSLDDNQTGGLVKAEPVYRCLSPSQRMLMEKTRTNIKEENIAQSNNFKKKIDYENKDHVDVVKTEPVNKCNDESSNLSFKSQTGSRLLALIRDQTVNKNISSSYKYRPFNSLNNIDKLNDYKNISITPVQDFPKSSKPTPPPRPRKFSSSFYESNRVSDFTENSLRSLENEKKSFHYSTGNLSKEIENDVSAIQNMHRYYKHIKSTLNDTPRRPSLPRDLCDQQMEYIKNKEREVESEISRLEMLNPEYRRGPKAPLVSEKEIIVDKFVDPSNYYHSRSKDVSYTSKEKGKFSSYSSQEEIQREKMYSEYVTEMAERKERKEQKIIKITTPSQSSISKSMSALDDIDSKVNNRIEKEFIEKAKERWHKLGITDPETEDEKEEIKVEYYREPKVIEHKIKVIEDGEEKDVINLPSHLQEFVRFTAKNRHLEKDSPETVMIAPTFKARSNSPAVWRPGAPTPPPVPPATPGGRSPSAPPPPATPGSLRSPSAPPPPPPPPVWTPTNAGTSPLLSRKNFRPVHFEESPPARRKFSNTEQNGCTNGSESGGRLRSSQSAPAAGLNALGGLSVPTSRLPKAQNPTVTLLQKAREGQQARGPSYLQQERDAARLPRDRASPPKGDPVYALRREYASEGEGDRSEQERVSRKMADGQKKVEGIGPVTKDGMPVALRSEAKDPSRWYKKMYDTIHKNKYDDDYVTIRYKSRRGQPAQRTGNKSQYAYFDPRSGYLSEPEGGLSRLGSSTWSDAYDSDVTTGPRRRTASVQEDRRSDTVSSPYLPSNKYSTLASARASQEIYKNQPGRIENYVPGRSSVIDKEAKQQISSTTSLPQSSPREKKDLTSNILAKSNMARALKESGYESDSTLVFRRREDAEAPLSPAERRAAYRDLQAGGEPPLRGFRSPAPPRQESPRRYLESDVNIHYRCPVRQDPLPLVPERELARQQAEHMKRLYREQRRNKYLQELQDMQNRRHLDNFTPSQKAIVPLNRYDEAEKVMARALYAFNGQTNKELSFRKGDLIHVRRQIDANWYEGELQGRIGLFPYNYVEIQKGDAVQPIKKPAMIEGRARAKFDFIAQTNLELPLKKGEVVILTRRIDHNWWEGRHGGKTGIFPDSYITVLQEPSLNKPELQVIKQSGEKPMASPAAHGLLNGSAKRSMGAHSYMPQPNSPALSNAPQPTQPLSGYVTKPARAAASPSDRGYGPPKTPGVDLNNTEPLYVDTNAEAVPYRAMYKYRPQNPDELELNEGDTVYVLEKCDDGWYVGSSQRTGRFGTFPGNYVERI